LAAAKPRSEIVEAVEEPKAAISGSGRGAQPYLLQICPGSSVMRRSPPSVRSCPVVGSSKLARRWIAGGVAVAGNLARSLTSFTSGDRSTHAFLAHPTAATVPSG
jgi:hypothetical protein